MSYSPVRHSLSPCEDRTFDLHVLGTPPAFILSQDQTRHPSCICTPASRQERHLHLSDPGQVLTLSLFADSSCSEIDRNCSCTYRSLTVTVLLPLFNCQGTDLAIPSGDCFTNDQNG